MSQEGQDKWPGGIVFSNQGQEGCPHWGGSAVLIRRVEEQQDQSVQETEANSLAQSWPCKGTARSVRALSPSSTLGQAEAGLCGHVGCAGTRSQHSPSSRLSAGSRRLCRPSFEVFLVNTSPGILLLETTRLSYWIDLPAPMISISRGHRQRPQLLIGPLLSVKPKEQGPAEGALRFP